MGRKIMPELIQGDFTPDALADKLAEYLTDESARAKAIADLKEANALLGDGDTARRAAAAVLDGLC